jgi:hypothetical protein
VKAAESVWSRWRRRKRGNVEVGENGEVIGRTVASNSQLNSVLFTPTK